MLETPPCCRGTSQEVRPAHPSSLAEYPVIQLMASPLSSSNVFSTLLSWNPGFCISRQGVQVSPYLNKNEKRILNWISPGLDFPRLATVVRHDVDGGDVPYLLRIFLHLYQLLTPTDSLLSPFLPSSPFILIVHSGGLFTRLWNISTALFPHR